MNTDLHEHQQRGTYMERLGKEMLHTRYYWWKLGETSLLTPAF